MVPAMKVHHYPVQPGLLAGEYPGHAQPEVALVRLQQLVDKDVRTFIDLTHEIDDLAPYEPLFTGIDDAGSLGLKRYSFQIQDMKIPTEPSVMQRALDRIRSEIAKDRACYVHCWGGIGRTGTVIGCWLRESGMDGGPALAEVQRLYASHMPPAKLARYPHSPQQAAQIRYVREWPDV